VVLAALERRGRPTTVPELSQEFRRMTPSEIVRVLDSLTRRGLVDWSGDRTWIYLGAIPVEREAEWIASGREGASLQPQRGLIDFPAPLFGDYVRRHHPLADLLATT
jgi:hypothetical protein